MNKLREIVNSLYSIREAYELSLGKQPPQGKCFCPFHNNHNTPAAKVYQTRLVCFGECGRSYDAYDMLSRFRPDLIEKAKSSGVIVQPTRPKERRTLPKFQGTLNNIIKMWLYEVSVQQW